MKIFSALLAAVMLFFNSAADAKIKFTAPHPTTEFEKMEFAPLYPTYSWEPLANTEFYLVQVLDENGEVIRELLNKAALNRVTDWQPFNKVGKYYWRVCVVDKHKNQLSAWSEPKLINVTSPVVFAALGDSITHGGASFIPAGQLSCQWETYCQYLIKNIGRSGDTTEMMIDRFESDVLPFQPKVLIIMGGVNDIRLGKTADEVINNLKILREKCSANDILAVFCTLTPMNNELMARVGIPFAKDWQKEQIKINEWILKNDGINVNERLVDFDGTLRPTITPDGLHPDMRGKMFIGKAIEQALTEKYFNFIYGVKEW